jgi:hypothetical protein
LQLEWIVSRDESTDPWDSFLFNKWFLGCFFFFFYWIYLCSSSYIARVFAEIPNPRGSPGVSNEEARCIIQWQRLYLLFHFLSWCSLFNLLVVVENLATFIKEDLHKCLPVVMSNFPNVNIIQEYGCSILTNLALDGGRYLITCWALSSET